MTRYVSDTHALVWHLQSNPKLSRTAAEIFRLTDDGQHRIFVPSIVLVEMVYLVEHHKIGRELVTKAFELLSRNNLNYKIAPLDTPTARTLLDIEHDKVPDMPDRIIAATARRKNLPLITRDERITKSGLIKVVW